MHGITMQGGYFGSRVERPYLCSTILDSESQTHDFACNSLVITAIISQYGMFAPDFPGGFHWSIWSIVIHSLKVVLYGIFMSKVRSSEESHQSSFLYVLALRFALTTVQTGALCSVSALYALFSFVSRYTQTFQSNGRRWLGIKWKSYSDPKGSTH